MSVTYSECYFNSAVLLHLRVCRLMKVFLNIITFLENVLNLLSGFAIVSIASCLTIPLLDHPFSELLSSGHKFVKLSATVVILLIIMFSISKSSLLHPNKPNGLY